MSTNEKSITDTTTISHPSMRSYRPSNAQMIQNFHLVWLDGSINEDHNDNYRNSIIQLRQIVNTVNRFIDADECIEFINGITEEKTFIITSSALGQITIPVVHDKPQVSMIYIFCENKAGYEKWAIQWPKVAGVYTDIIALCEALKQSTQDCDHNSVPISFLPAIHEAWNENMDILDSSFTYTLILKETLLSINYKQEHFNKFLTYCHEQLSDNSAELRNVEKLRREYHHHQPIWWYTYECFLNSMLNRALYLMDLDLIIKMGFFIRDLHNHIAAAYAVQYEGQNDSNTFTVYRGQGLSQADFDQLKTTQRGLLSFNNFLWTSQSCDVSIEFARRATATSNLVGVLFVIKIDPSISTTPFANIGNTDYYQAEDEEDEILFSIHSVFRIGQVKQIDKINRLWQVDLTLTSEKESQLYSLIERMLKETKGSTGWHRLGKLLIKLGQLNQAEELYDALLKQTSSESEKAHLFHQLGWIKNDQGKYAEAVRFYENSMIIKQKILPPTHSRLASSYNNIGSLYWKMGENSKALSYYEKALVIRKKDLPLNHPDLATSYSNIALAYNKMSEYSKALSYYEKVLKIRQKTLPENHPDLATSYSIIGLMYDNMGEYAKALSYYEKTLEIIQKTLPANHPSLATSYNNIGIVYNNIGEYAKALSYYEKALEIRQKILLANHPDLATTYNSIGLVSDHMGQYLKALSYHEKALDIYRTTLPENHPDLATSYNNIGTVYNNMGEYAKALSSHEKELEIRQKTLPPNHPDLATSYNNIATVYYNKAEYSRALSYYEKSLEIDQKTLLADHPLLATSYNNIGWIYRNMRNYSKALSFYERALDIRQRSLPSNHPDLDDVRKSVEIMKKKL